MSDEYQPTTEACLRCVVMERELAEARTDLMNRDVEFAALRQRHAEAVEKAYLEAWQTCTNATDREGCCDVAPEDAWLASEAKARLT